MNTKSNRIMEEQKELNLVEILKDCPKGMELYSTIYGEVKLEKVEDFEDSTYSIYFYHGNNLQCVTKNGLHLVQHDGECTLFPSKDNRDWSTFKVEKPKWNPDTLQPFDKVLARTHDCDEWLVDFFIYEDYGIYCGLQGNKYRCMIPYNEETGELAGTMDEAPEYYRL